VEVNVIIVNKISYSNTTKLQTHFIRCGDEGQC